MERVADLAHGLLARRGNPPGDGRTLIQLLVAAGIDNPAALDGLIKSHPRTARAKLGVRTLTDAERILTALRRARKELK